MDQADKELVQAQPLFSGLPPDLLERMIGTAVPRRYDKGRTLFQRGDPADFFYIVLDGWVKIFRTTADGGEAVLGVFSRGDMFAEAAAFLGSGYPADAQVVDEATLLAIDSKRFVAELHAAPDIALNILASMSRHLHRLVHEVECLKTRSAGQRLVEFLLRRCGADDGAVVLSLPYDKNLIAARLGIKPESLSRLLNKLRELGVETHQNRVSITDVARLRDYCMAEEDELNGNRAVG